MLVKFVNNIFFQLGFCYAGSSPSVLYAEGVLECKSWNLHAHLWILYKLPALLMHRAATADQS